MMLGSAPIVVVDTSVVSIVHNRNRSLQRAFYEQQLEGNRPVISFQTLEEAWYGAYNANWGASRRQELARNLQQYEVIFPNSGLIDTCARLRADRRSVGRELQMADAWIAATALLLSCPLAADDGDFESIPSLQLIRSPR